MKIDLYQLDDMDDKVVEIAYAVEKHFAVEFEISSLLRPNDVKSVHGYGRGIDLRCPVMEFGYIVERYVNATYQYDPTRPKKQCCKYHNSGTGWHLHLQSHPNTKIR